MSISSIQAYYEPLRILIDTDFTNDQYFPMGNPLLFASRIIRITNTTDANMIFTLDPTIDEGQEIVAAGTAIVTDFGASRNENGTMLAISANTTIWVKYEVDPPTHANPETAVYLSTIYAR
jgi:hypothetical protein